MKKRFFFIALICSLCTISFSQNNNTRIIKGRIINDNQEALANASIVVKGLGAGTRSDKYGTFRLIVPSLPVKLEVSFIEFETREIAVVTDDSVIVILESTSKMLDPFITGELKVKSRRNKSSVSIEVLDRKDFLSSTSDVYSAILPKKGLDVTISSLTYKTYSTRGFNGSGSSRVNQLMDGMDNQAPGLNFSVGNFIGLTDLDIESIEILPGASSALYGPGGMNGTILINSKNPFKYQGLSILAKQGVTGLGKKQREKTGDYMDYSIRWAKSIGDRFAFKIGVQYLEATDWLANDSSNYLRTGSTGKVIPGNRNSDPNYDGVNVYGDETKADIRGFMTSSPDLQQIFAGYLATPQNVSRTGYNEAAFIDPKTKNLKLSGALHYKISNTIEAMLMGYWANGSTVYTGNNRYVFKGIKMGQYKLELNHKNWFIRGYTTQENAGDAYSATVTSQYFNEAWKKSLDMNNPDASWYPQYFQAFANGAIPIFQTAFANSGSLADAQAAVVAAGPQLHTAARAVADQGRPAPGSKQFNQIFDQVRKIPIPNGGLFLDKSDLWMAEGQYNFSERIKFAEIIIGGNLKKYVLNSQGTIFIDTAGALKINEWGSYVQVRKPLLNKKLILSASARYDKNQNFEGKFTPRLTAVFEIAPGHNLRMSYQTAYKFPTTQQQWIKLDVGNAILLGGLPWINDYLKTKSVPTFILDPATGQTTPYSYKELKPEILRSFEIGIKSSVNKKLLIDAYVYLGVYDDFLGRIIVVQPTAIKPFSVVTNSDTKVKAWGSGVGVDYKMAKNYITFFNAYTDNLSNVPNGFEAGFNTPKLRINAGFGNAGLGKEKRIGFNIVFRWQDDCYWEGGGLANGTVPSYTTFDAQVNYQLPKVKSMIKLGGTNLSNKYYQTGFGNPYIGNMYYISFGYNVL